MTASLSLSQPQTCLNLLRKVHSKYTCQCSYSLLLNNNKEIVLDTFWKSWQVCEQADSYKPVSNFGQGSDNFQMFLVARKPFGIYEQNHSKNQFPRLHLSQNIKSHVVGFLTKIDFKSLQQLECETDSVVSHSGTFKERVHRKRSIFWISKEIALILDPYINTSIFNSWWNRNSVFWLENLYFWKICLFRDDIGKYLVWALQRKVTSCE